MHQGMGSILGGATRDLAWTSRRGRTPAPGSGLSPRAASYALDTPSLARTAVESFNTTTNMQPTPRSCVSRPTAWSASLPAGPARFQMRLAKRCCSQDSVRAAPPEPSPRHIWGTAAAPCRKDVRHRGARILPLPAVQSSTEAASDMEVPFTSSSGTTVMIRKINTQDELRQVATLRAEAYYAENQSRFVGSLKKKFVEQEVESLQQRTTIMSRQGKPYSECLVAVDPTSGAVLACIDMRLPAALNGTHPHGVPQDDPQGCYLLNVVVQEDVRGQGLGRGIMRAAMTRAVHKWGAGRLYTHVGADNEVAYHLYNSCGFERHSADAKYEAASKLGQTVLMCAPADAAPAA